MNVRTQMNDHIYVIFVKKHFDDKTIFGIINIHIQKKNHLNVKNVIKDFVSFELYKFIKFLRTGFFSFSF